MSSQVVWACVKNTSCFLRKQRNGVAFSADRLNLTNINSSRFNGLSSTKALGITIPAAGEKAVMTLKTKRSKQPKRSAVSYPLRRGFKRNAKAIKAQTNGYRSDLKAAALARYTKIAQGSRTRKQKTRERKGR